ncbi:MAG: hypothetical protein LUG99_10170 [Lachnospiraceae bacterium]|nr:hypothetical protein [Lachnospiraceae bacterium]
MTEIISSRQEKLWKTKTTRVNLQMTIYGRRACIFLTKDVIRVLGVPGYVCFKVNEAWDSIVVMPCADKEQMSFRVPDNILFTEKKMEFKSKAFTDALMDRNVLNHQGTYHVPGLYYENCNVVVFDLKDNSLYSIDK